MIFVYNTHCTVQCFAVIPFLHFLVELSVSAFSLNHGQLFFVVVSGLGLRQDAFREKNVLE